MQAFRPSIWLVLLLVSYFHFQRHHLVTLSSLLNAESVCRRRRRHRHDPPCRQSNVYRFCGVQISCGKFDEKNYLNEKFQKKQILKNNSISMFELLRNSSQPILTKLDDDCGPFGGNCGGSVKPNSHPLPLNFGWLFHPNENPCSWVRAIATQCWIIFIGCCRCSTQFQWRYHIILFYDVSGMISSCWGKLLRLPPFTRAHKSKPCKSCVYLQIWPVIFRHAARQLASV